MPTEENPSGNEIEPLEHPLVAASKKENLPILRNQALHRYLQEISQYELLSREEIDELAVRFRETGDPDAAYRLVSANLRLVVKVAMDFQKHWMQNFMDLIQEGNVGLVHPNADWRLPVRPRAKSYRLSATTLTRVGSYKGLAAKPLLHKDSRLAAQFISETPVQLSGHTHGGHLFFIKWLIASFNGGLVGSLFDQDRKILWVSPGTGIWAGFSCRLGIPSEITRINL